jgi:hypothetical protein
MKSNSSTAAKGKTVHAKIQPVVVKHVIKEKPMGPTVPTLPNLASIDVNIIFIITKYDIAHADHSWKG